MEEVKNLIILSIADFIIGNNPDQFVMKFTTALRYLSLM